MGWFDEQRRIEFARRLEDEFDIATYVEYLQKTPNKRVCVYIYCKLKQARTAAASPIDKHRWRLSFFHTSP